MRSASRYQIPPVEPVCPPTPTRSIRIIPAVVGVGVLICACLTGLALGAVIHVPGDQPTIQSGINAASWGDTVLVACGVYREHDIMMASGICLRSETGKPECVTIDGQRVGRLISCDGTPGETRIEGFTLTGGSVDGRGGAIYLNSPSPTISRCLFIGNSATDGGSALSGHSSDPLITECRFVGNERTIDGGAIYLDDSSPTFSYCVIAGNSALFWGGGIFCSGASPVISHCTIVGNWAGDTGGGIWCVYRSHPVLEDTIVASNTHGAGLYTVVDLVDPSDMRLTCCDVFGNVGGNYAGALHDQTGMNGNISQDPLFCDATMGDYRLGADSPCLPENNTCGVLMGALEGCESPAAGPEDGGKPIHLSWRATNPFRPGSPITFELPVGGEVSLSVIDPSGRTVRTLLGAVALDPGVRSVRWDGEDAVGRACPRGIYFLRLQVGKLVEIRKVALAE